jgi:hypothetical protein
MMVDGAQESMEQGNVRSPYQGVYQGAYQGTCRTATNEGLRISC